MKAGVKLSPLPEVRPAKGYVRMREDPSQKKSFLHFLKLIQLSLAHNSFHEQPFKHAALQLCQKLIAMCTLVHLDAESSALLITGGIRQGCWLLLIGLKHSATVYTAYIYSIQRKMTIKFYMTTVATNREVSTTLNVLIFTCYCFLVVILFITLQFRSRFVVCVGLPLCFDN